MALWDERVRDHIKGPGISDNICCNCSLWNSRFEFRWVQLEVKFHFGDVQSLPLFDAKASAKHRLSRCDQS
jgi:hypothetical protein